MNQETKDYLTLMGNPYAKLSVLDMPVWDAAGDFLVFLGQCFSTAQFGKKSPREFRPLADLASALSGKAQAYAYGRLMALVPPVAPAFNRLAPNKLKELQQKVQAILEEAKTLDAPEE